MNHTFLITTALFFISIASQAQVWQVSGAHNGYSCLMMKTSDNVTVYAAKGMIYSNEALFFKIRVPFDWNDRGGTGCVGVFSENIVTKAKSSQTSYFDYRNGWLYFTEYLWEWCSGVQQRGDFPCNTFVITLYEKNDHGRAPGKKIVVDMKLDKLNVSRMPMNRQNFETHW